MLRRTAISGMIGLGLASIGIKSEISDNPEKITELPNVTIKHGSPNLYSYTRIHKISIPAEFYFKKKV